MNVDLDYIERALLQKLVNSELSVLRANLAEMKDAKDAGREYDVLMLAYAESAVTTLASIDKKVEATFS